MTEPSLSPPLEAIKIIVEIGLEEDAARFDRTTALLPETLIVDAAIVAKGRTVVCGIDALAFAFGPSVKLDLFVNDGDVVRDGNEIAAMRGSARALLSAERTTLNILGQLSGIATLTRQYVDRLAPDSSTQILDTRKTTPGLRSLEKYAVRCGGGFNHRMTLADKIFVKDNHIAAVGGLKKLLGKRKPGDYLIIEVDYLKNLDEALKYKPDRVLLDNMSDVEIEKAVEAIGDAAEIEVSGGVTLDRVNSISRLGVDFISVGAVTHSAPASDFSLEIRR